MKQDDLEHVAMPIFGIVIIIALSIIVHNIYSGLKKGHTIKEIVRTK